MIEFDAAGNGAVILTGANGLTGPFGGNCLAWDTLGRFFVINEYGFQALLRYEYASRNPLVLADWQDGLRGGGGIIVDRNGDVLVASRFLQRVTPDGEVSVIDPYFGSNGFPFARSVAIDRRHNRLYVAADHGVFPRGRIHRYRGFDPGTREMILTGFRPLDTAITIVLSNDDAELLIVDESNLYSVNVETLEQRVLFTAPVEPEFARLLGRGMVIAKAPKPGDMNCDNWVNNFDIDPFVLALTDEAGYAARFGWCDRTRADVNRDGTIDNFDIDAFVAAVIADTGD
ncbi:MAG: hypothetical protein JNG88_18115 [Phycisphaerales bacterium]|nr:hypothetical protein [Phycisphaerales bacterium]